MSDIVVPFTAFPKIGRLRRDIVVTEKIDGTNAAVRIEPLMAFHHANMPYVAVVEDLVIYAQSRSRFITPADDTFGFARWVSENAPELVTLGPGIHFGEWWGQGIQRNYGQKRKIFSLFNTSRWGVERPACCDVVPVLYSGLWAQNEIDACVSKLREQGSVVAPGFMNPEGIVVYHAANNALFKQTLEKDDTGKEQ